MALPTPRIFVPALQPPVSHVGFQATIGAQAAGWLVGETVSDGTQNAEITFGFTSEAGTFDLVFLHRRNTNRGIYTIQIDGATITTVDGYNGSAVATRSVVTGVALTAGEHSLRLLMATKNASSSSFFGAISAFIFRRTGA